MNNTKALTYLSYLKIKGVVRNLFRKPIRAIFSILGIVLIFVLMINISLRDAIEIDSGISQYGFMAIVSAMPILMLFLLIFNKKTALLYLNDANFLFVGPFSDKQIKLYIIWQSIQQMIALGFMFVLYLAIFFNYLIIDASILYLGIVITSLSIYAIIMYTDYYYVSNASREYPSKVKYWLPFLILAMIIFVAIASNLNQSDMSIIKIIERLLEHPMFSYIPFLGWAYALQNGNYWLGVLCPVVLGLVYTYLFFQHKGDYYEKAIDDALYVTSQRQKINKAGGNQEALDSMMEVKKVTKTKNFKFLGGGWALLSRQILHLIKTRKLLDLQQLFMLGIYTAIAMFSGEAELYQLMLMISVLFITNTDVLESELSRHYIYLVPDHNFKKLLASLSIMIIRVLTYSLIAFLFLVFFFKLPLMSSILFSLNLVAVSLMYQASLVLVLRILGLQKNKILQMFIQLIVFLIVLVPSGLIVFLLLFIVELNLDQVSIVTMILNIISTFLLLYASKGVVDGVGIVD